MSTSLPPISFIQPSRNTDRTYERVEVPFDNILHFKAEQKYVIATALNGREYTLDVPLKELAATYGEHVVLSHRAHLVVVKHIESVKWSRSDDAGVVRLSNGETVPVSRRNHKIAIAASRRASNN